MKPEEKKALLDSAKAIYSISCDSVHKAIAKKDKNALDRASTAVDFTALTIRVMLTSIGFSDEDIKNVLA